MATPQEFTSLLNETKKAKQAMYVVLDYVDLVNKHGNDLSPEALSVGDKIKDHGHEIGKHIEELRLHINSTLNKIPVDNDEIRTAAERLILYNGSIDEAMTWSESQKKGQEENSYWWRYWQAVYDRLKEKKAEL